MTMQNIRSKFPIFQKRGAVSLIYFDNAATTQKPAAVLEAMDKFYRFNNATVHRGVYKLAEQATESYEGVRDQVRDFIHAKHREEIIFTSGTTASVNLVVQGLAQTFLRRGDNILLSDMEHHAMVVPWQEAAKRRKLKLNFVPLTREGLIDMSAFKKLLRKYRPKFVGLTHVSNVLGTVNPLNEMISLAHKMGAVVLVDAAQSVAHIPINVRKLNCDFLAFSGHKMYGPTGVGILWGKRKLLENLPPYTYGGHMIERVSRKETIYAVLPAKFEAGTPPVAEVIGLGAAISFLKDVGFNAINRHEHNLTIHALKALGRIPDLTLFGPGTSRHRAPIFSFTIKGIHSHDISALLDREGIAMRAGNHCTQILHDSLSLNSSVRASLCVYNTTEEIDALTEGLLKVRKKIHG